MTIFDVKAKQAAIPVMTYKISESSRSSFYQKLSVVTSGKYVFFVHITHKGSPQETHLHLVELPTMLAPTA